MKFIGITGGVGAGKSEILHYIENRYPAKILLADELAHELMQPGTECFRQIQKAFAREDIFAEDGSLDAVKLADVIFAEESKRNMLNAIVHPAVKEEIINRANQEKKSKKTEWFLVEAALLIEEGYDKICDELWFIDTKEQIRRQRLKESRGYTDEKIDAIFQSQLPEETYRRFCKLVIDNSGSREKAFSQIDKAFMQGRHRMENKEYEQPLVFGLDIGTRNVVGTVGFLKDKEFIVVAQCMEEHDTRAMLDGQIHDIRRVGDTIRAVKENLEEQVGQVLTSVCIAAAGRVLKTITTHVEYEYPEESVVTAEDIHTLDIFGIDKAQGILKEKNDTKYKFYCVGYSVVKYYINDEIFSNLEGHKAEQISEDIIVTFLPEDVVDGLYAAVGAADLTVANLTLEPIAAINVAIPENFRLLNIALVDVGAGTSDICITRDGSIIAYGMIPIAGDEITEILVQHYLVDFATAEHIKLASSTGEPIEYRDIMNIKHTIPAKEVWDLTAPVVERITTDVTGKIKELNGEQTVSATFVVGGGGKIHDFTQLLADKLELPYERVALRGEEVLQEVSFLQEDIKKDPLLVTPIGICLNYYTQKNNFIMVHFNGERVKLYDNSKLTIVDAAVGAGFPNDQLFPRRGKEITFMVNGRQRIVRGEPGESAVVKVNGKVVSINTPLIANTEITIEPSTLGADAHCTISELEEYTKSDIAFVVNGQNIICPKFVEVNGSLEPPYYEVQDNDQIETRSFYTVGQVAEFMDVTVNTDYEILVNNRQADLNTLVYENFTIEWQAETAYPEAIPLEEEGEDEADAEAFERRKEALRRNPFAPKLPEKEEEAAKVLPDHLTVLVNGKPVELTGKPSYVFVDIFYFIDFNLAESNGRRIVTNLNGEKAEYTKRLEEGDQLEIYWKENDE